jgi:DTW domain-containing protein YfiP
MTHLCIENSKLIHGTGFQKNSTVNELIADPKNHCIVLYPGANSRNISAHPSEEVQSWFPKDKTLVIFIIDGTWACAKRMIVRSPNLIALPQIGFTPKNRSSSSHPGSSRSIGQSRRAS